MLFDRQWKRGLAIGLLVATVGGCGNTGGESGSSRAVSGERGRLQHFLEAPVTGPARSFIASGQLDSTVIYGHEASDPERDQASHVVTGWMRARSRRAWGKDCHHMSLVVKKPLLKDAHGVTQGRAKTCAQALSYFGSQASGNLVNTMTGPIDSFRVEDDHGFALYHGRSGHDWAVTMDREGGKWKVSATTPS